MSHRHTCNLCSHPIANGEARIRTVRFEQVAYHGDCLELAQMIDDLVELVAQAIDARLATVEAEQAITLPAAA